MDIKVDYSIGRFMTFELPKEKPVHRWFWYKEGYAPEMADFALQTEKIGRGSLVLDPFCGVGTTLLASKDAGMRSIGVDASPLAVFVSKTKTADYEKSDIERALAFILKTADSSRDAQAEWEFELFSPRAAFPKRNYNEILAIRGAIEREDGKARDLLLLALLSILPQASIIVKDGGVLKIDKRKRALPAREAFRRKVKQMAADLQASHARSGAPAPEVFLGDARGMDVGDGSVDIVITSPPYLNNIDYSKIYGLELSLLDMSKAEAEETRMRSVRSFIGRRMAVGDMPPEVGDIGYQIPVIGTYFKDMESAIAEMHRVLRPGGAAYVVVSNSVIHQTHVMVDEVLAEIGERIGFSESTVIIGTERIADVRPQKVKTRESAVVLRN